MQSFRRLDHFFGHVPAPTARLLREVDIARGRQEAFRLQNPAILETLTHVALVQSVEASNALENIRAPHRRIEELVAEKTTPRNRSEAEIAGYRDVLNTIHANWEHIPMRPSIVEQLHRDLYQFSARPGGRFKGSDNVVEEVLADGSKRTRFVPVGWFETPAAMEELCARFDDARHTDRYHPLLLAAAFVLDFLVVHPFSDGNGRMARLLALLLLYQAGYEVGRFVSVEKLIEQTRTSYYDSLERSTHGWHDGNHDLQPWTEYFLGILVAAYRAFEERAAVVTSGRGAKADLVKAFIRARASDTFEISDVREAVPAASDVYIRELLRKLRAERVLEQVGRGRGARWRRLHTDF